MVGGREKTLTKETYLQVAKQLIKNSKMIILPDTGEIFAAHSISAIVLDDKSRTNDNTKLIGKGYFKCKFGVIHILGQKGDPHAMRCDCSEYPQQSIQKDPEIQKFIASFVSTHSIKQIS